MSIFKPMLATDAELDKLRFPLLASAKLDGIRAVVREGVVYSRSNKPIPNKHVQELFSEYQWLDGELIVGDPTSKTVYRDTSSGVMSEEGTPDVSFFVFDHVVDIAASYRSRSLLIEAAIKKYKAKQVEIHQQIEISSIDRLLTFEARVLELGYEGLILRDPNAPYKMGRSTVKEGYLLKLKRFMDSEAVVIGFEERMRNGNIAKTNELGRTARSSHKENKHGRGDLGALVLRTPDGVEFSCGTGFTDSERGEIWASRDRLLGATAKYKFFPVGVKEAPRHPVFLGWRMKEDM